MLDGDTVEISGNRIRIANIDAPELHQAKCDAERRLAIVARNRMAEILVGGTIIVHPGDPKDGRLKDRQGWMLAAITVDGKDVGDIMIAESLARPWEGKRQPWCEATEPHNGPRD